MSQISKASVAILDDFIKQSETVIIKITEVVNHANVISNDYIVGYLREGIVVLKGEVEKLLNNTKKALEENSYNTLISQMQNLIMRIGEISSEVNTINQLYLVGYLRQAVELLKLEVERILLNAKNYLTKNGGIDNNKIVVDEKTGELNRKFENN